MAMRNSRTDSRESKRRLRSFLRWVGGKRLLTSKLLPFFPVDASDRKYHEPFLGAASLFFALRPRRAYLSDLNRHLIECYRVISRDHRSVAAYLRWHETHNSESHYYEVREVYNRSRFSVAQAARFIYLNRTCFNGVFRVNRDGHFNVPFGNKPNPLFPTEAELSRVSEALKHARLTTADYSTSLRRARSGDLVYLDPPYPPLNGTSYFTHYTADRFSLDQQKSLAAEFDALDQRGCLVIMTNADTALVRRLYKAYSLTRLTVPRYVTCKSKKHRVSELVITNYDPPSSS